ncbi:MAG: hypothetical protein CL920_00035 [Deltaproteobacteria bacterium]|nr:hypothetical protein [Deltaproteobacteria bacterium]
MRVKSEHKKRLDEFEHKMDQCRVQYENFFRGADGREPIWLRREVEKHMKFFRRCKFRSVSDRNRFNTLATRCGILLRYWDTVIREQGEGVFREKHKRGNKRAEEASKNDNTTEPPTTTPDEEHTHLKEEETSSTADVPQAANEETSDTPTVANEETSAQEPSTPHLPTSPLDTATPVHQQTSEESESKPTLAEPPSTTQNHTPAPSLEQKEETVEASTAERNTLTTPAPQPVQASPTTPPTQDESTNHHPPKITPPPPSLLPHQIDLEHFDPSNLQGFYQQYIAAREYCGESINGLSFQKFAKKMGQRVPAMKQKGHHKIELRVRIQDGKTKLEIVGKSPTS